MLIVGVVLRGRLDLLVPPAPICDEVLDLLAAKGVRKVAVRDYAGDHLRRLDEVWEKLEELRGADGMIEQ